VKLSSELIYTIQYLVEGGNNKPDAMVSEKTLQRGDIVHLNDLSYYCVVAVVHTDHQYSPDNRSSIIFLSMGAQRPLHAMEAAIEYKHLPESFWPFLPLKNE